MVPNKAVLCKTSLFVAEAIPFKINHIQRLFGQVEVDGNSLGAHVVVLVEDGSGVFNLTDDLTLSQFVTHDFFISELAAADGDGGVANDFGSYVFGSAFIKLGHEAERSQFFQGLAVGSNAET